MEYGVRSVLDIQLNFLRDIIAAKQRCDHLRAINPSGYPGGADVVAIDDNPRPGRDRTVIVEKIPGRPVRGSHPAAQDAGGSAKAGLPAQIVKTRWPGRA